MADVMDVIVWSVIPQDTCPFALDGDGDHPDWTDDPMAGLGIPVAVSGIEENRQWMQVRYICPHCRHIWDMGYDCTDGVMGEQFGDRFIRDAERKVAPKGHGGCVFPAGPADQFESDSNAASESRVSS